MDGDFPEATFSITGRRWWCLLQQLCAAGEEVRTSKGEDWRGQCRVFQDAAPRNSGGCGLVPGEALSLLPRLTDIRGGDQSQGQKKRKRTSVPGRDSDPPPPTRLTFCKTGPFLHRQIRFSQRAKSFLKSADIPSLLHLQQMSFCVWKTTLIIFY